MNVYERHMWSLNIDFIECFKELHFNQIPLPLFLHFHSLLNRNVRRQMKATSFADRLHTKIVKEKEIQPQFNRYLDPIFGVVDSGKVINGKPLLLNDPKLRFPQSFFDQYFPKKAPIIVENIAKVELPDLTKKYIQKAESIFNHVHHPVFNKKWFRKKWLAKIPKIVENAVAVDRYLQKTAVSCVIVGYSGSIESRILTLLAARKGIPSICMQHGLILSGHSAFAPCLASKHAVYGPYEYEWYAQRGVGKEKLAIVGHPRFDAIFTRKPMSRKVFINRLKLHPKRKSVLIVTQAIRDIKKWETIIRYLAKKLTINIIIKPHKIEIKKNMIDPYKKLARQYSRVKLNIDQVSLYDAIANVDVVINHSSTVGLEAMLYGKPVLTVEMDNTLGEGAQKYYSRKLLGKLVQSDSRRLAVILQRLLKDKKMKRYAQIRRKKFLSRSYVSQPTQQLSGQLLHRLIHEVTGRKPLRESEL